MKKSLLVVPFTLIIGQANAQDVNHFLSEDKSTLGYHNTNVDGNVLGQSLDFSLSGYSLSVGHQWQNNLYVRTDYTTSEGDVEVLEINNAVQLASLSLVTGMQFEVTTNGRLYGEAGYQAFAIEVSNYGAYQDDTITDFILGAGYKHQFGNLIAEVNTHYFDGESQFGGELLYAFNSGFAIAAGASTTRDEISYNAQLVFNF